MSKGQETRQRIIETAAPIFNQRGYSGCSMNDVMTATGLEKGGLYRHFASKETLAVEAFRYAAHAALETRLGDLDEFQGSVAKLRHMVRHFVQRPSPIPGGCPLMNAAVDADDSNPALLACAQQAMKTWKTRLVRIVEDGIQAREIRKGTDPRRIANILISTLEGALMMSRIEGNRTPMRDAQAALETVIAAIAL
jgi:AcrR family transcriptional regulator